MDAIIQWVLQRFVESWAAIEIIAQWANAHVLAAIGIGFFLREVIRYIVKITPNKYDDLCLEMLEDAIKKTFLKVSEVKKQLDKGEMPK